MSTYQTSKDYALLWELAIAGAEIACFMDWEDLEKTYRDIAKARKNHWRKKGAELRVPGVCYFDAETKEEFIELCKKYHVEFIPPSGWIPVSERLPEKEGLYIVSIKGYDKVSDVLYFRPTNVFNFFGVTAWMPLPKPYEVGK